jgi:replication factor A1
VLQKRDLTLIDDSMHEIKLTLWGDKATSPHYCWDNNPVLAVKGAKIGDYNGRNLGSLSSTAITLNPDIPEGQEMHMWKCKFNGAIPVGASMSTGGAGNDDDA